MKDCREDENKSYILGENSCKPHAQPRTCIYHMWGITKLNKQKNNIIRTWTKVMHTHFTEEDIQMKSKYKDRFEYR